VLPEQVPIYVEARRRLGRDDGRVALGNQWIVAEDPEREFARMGRHVLHQINAYAEFGAFGPPADVPRLDDPQQVVALGHYQLLDGPAAAELLVRQIRSGPVEDVFSWTLFPGEPVESAGARLEYFAATVMPSVRAELARPR
jgi:hypothetical protein